MSLPFYPQPKPRPRKLEKADRTKERVDFDEEESAKAKVRAAGRCEIVVIGQGRCRRKDYHTHHMLGGIGVRGRGESALAKRKQRTCAKCHADIGANVLKRRQHGRLPHFTDSYERLR